MNINEEEVSTSEGASTNSALNTWKYALSKIFNFSMDNFLIHWFDLKVEESYSKNKKPKITDIYHRIRNIRWTCTAGECM